MFTRLTGPLNAHAGWSGVSGPAIRLVGLGGELSLPRHCAVVLASLRVTPSPRVDVPHAAPESPRPGIERRSPNFGVSGITPGVHLLARLAAAERETAGDCPARRGALMPGPHSPPVTSGAPAADRGPHGRSADDARDCMAVN